MDESSVTNVRDGKANKHGARDRTSWKKRQRTL